jgi:Trehalase
MVPHIVFHVPDPDYSPGPELWDSAGCEGAPRVPTSGITQPPVLATAVRALHEADPDTGFLGEVVPALERWHRWLHDERSVESGLVAILHPWEAADNSPRFDAALARLETAELPAVERTDQRVIAADERPTDSDYVGYRYLVERLREQGYRPASPADAPFAYTDLTFNSILAAAEDDLAVLWNELGGDASRANDAARRLREALSRRWNETRAIYEEDGADGEADETIDGLFPLYAGVPSAAQARRLCDEALWSPARFGPSRDAPWPVTSASKASPAFDPRRYWRGPVWVNINWFLVQGLARAGLRVEAERLADRTLDLVSRSGFAEYYDPTTGEPLGARDFSWSASLTLDLLLRDGA